MHPVGVAQFLVRVPDRERLRHAGKGRLPEDSLRPRASSGDNPPGPARCAERQAEPIGLEHVARHIAPPAEGIWRSRKSGVAGVQVLHNATVDDWSVDPDSSYSEEEFNSTRAKPIPIRPSRAYARERCSTRTCIQRCNGCYTSTGRRQFSSWPIRKRPRPKRAPPLQSSPGRRAATRVLDEKSGYKLFPQQTKSRGDHPTR